MDISKYGHNTNQWLQNNPTFACWQGRGNLVATGRIGFCGIGFGDSHHSPRGAIIFVDLGHGIEENQIVPSTTDVTDLGKRVDNWKYCSIKFSIRKSFSLNL